MARETRLLRRAIEQLEIELTLLTAHSRFSDDARRQLERVRDSLAHLRLEIRKLSETSPSGELETMPSFAAPEVEMAVRVRGH